MATKQQPAYRAFTVTGKDDQAFWTCFGAAWTHRNGEGFSIELTSMPLDGRTVLMPPKSRNEEDAS